MVEVVQFTPIMTAPSGSKRGGLTLVESLECIAHVLDRGSIENIFKVHESLISKGYWEAHHRQDYEVLGMILVTELLKNDEDSWSVFLESIMEQVQQGNCSRTYWEDMKRRSPFQAWEKMAFLAE